jgi:exosome complex component CSL4
MSQILLPGQPIPGTSKTGTGTYERQEYTLSSLVGQISSKNGQQEINHGTKPRFVVPMPGSTILGRITRVNARQANVSILIVDGQPCAPGDWNSCGYTNQAAGEDPSGADFTGVIRTQDVRQTEKDKIRMQDCFRPGDIVKAIVISLGDSRSYFLATTQNHLGVVYALPALSDTALNSRSHSQQPMIPINWQEMQDPQTGIIEKRKVAKPDDV